MSVEQNGPLSALVLTDREWETLGFICSHYLAETAWVIRDERRRRDNRVLVHLIEQERALCERILKTLADD